MRLKSVACMLALAAGVAAWGGVQAQGRDYPTKPIRVIIPLAPGGPSDILARLVGQKLTAYTHEAVVIDNRPGAGGTLGTTLAARAAPDGYTMLLLGESTLAINASLYSHLPYDTLKDLTAVSILAGAPYLLVVHPSLPVHTLKQFIAFVHAHPGELNYASGGTGTGPQLAMEVFKDKLHLNIVHIPYKGAGPALNDTMAGQVQAMMVNMIAGLPLVKAGRLRALGQSGATRAPAAQDIPTLSEAGAAGYDMTGQHMVLVPGGTPRKIVVFLNREIVRALHTKAVADRLAAEGAQVIGSTPEEAGRVLRADIAEYGATIKRLGLKID